MEAEDEKRGGREPVGVNENEEGENEDEEEAVVGNENEDREEAVASEEAMAREPWREDVEERASCFQPSCNTDAMDLSLSSLTLALSAEQKQEGGQQQYHA